jgi:outer membrane protein OmpA-like peptidoglycan-associated protein
MAKLLASAPSQKFLIVGHTDNQGNLDYNVELSRRRAVAVVTALTTRHGIHPTQVIPVGVGMAAPVAPNTDEAGRTQNRRVEIVAM